MNSSIHHHHHHHFEEKVIKRDDDRGINWEKWSEKMGKWGDLFSKSCFMIHKLHVYLLKSFLKNRFSYCFQDNWIFSGSITFWISIFVELISCSAELIICSMVLEHTHNECWNVLESSNVVPKCFVKLRIRSPALRIGSTALVRTIDMSPMRFKVVSRCSEVLMRIAWLVSRHTDFASWESEFSTRSAGFAPRSSYFNLQSPCRAPRCFRGSPK